VVKARTGRISVLGLAPLARLLLASRPPRGSPQDAQEQSSSHPGCDAGASRLARIYSFVTETTMQKLYRQPT
jgi:hypothetical protein